LADTRQKENWIRLTVADFEKAWVCLQKAGLVTDRRNGKPDQSELGIKRRRVGPTDSFPAQSNGFASGLILLAQNIGTDRVVRELVKGDVPVYEIARHEETLEDFYLSLMGQQRTETGGGK
jgi:hypothetical protein